MNFHQNFATLFRNCQNIMCNYRLCWNLQNFLNFEKKSRRENKHFSKNTHPVHRYLHLPTPVPSGHKYRSGHSKLERPRPLRVSATGTEAHRPWVAWAASAWLSGSRDGRLFSSVPTYIVRKIFRLIKKSTQFQQNLSRISRNSARLPGYWSKILTFGNALGCPETPAKFRSIFGENNCCCSFLRRCFEEIRRSGGGDIHLLLWIASNNWQKL